MRSFRRLSLSWRSSCRFRASYGFLVVLLFGSVLLYAENPPKMSPKTRQEILHAFNAELVYIRTNFPMGKTGLKLKNGTITPSGDELKQLMAMWGPACKPGDRAEITNVTVKGDYIRFDINGGPGGKKWYQHIQIEGSTTVTPGSGENVNAHGSFVNLYFDKYVPELTGPELKKFLRPVFDFDSKTGLEAYLLTVPPKVKDAITQHKVLVGMNQDMVIYAKGRPPRRVREKDGETDYEEWVYGTPPEDVDFVRFVGDEVVRVETMSVDGKKVVWVEKEVDLGEPTVAKKQEGRPANAPTLRRPGEEVEVDHSDTPHSPVYLPPPPSAPPGSDPGPNYAR